MGKGSKRRQENFKQIQNNWDSINWKSKKKEPKYLDEEIQACKYCGLIHCGCPDEIGII